MNVVLPIAGTSDTYTVAPSKIIALGLNYAEHIAESVSVKVRGFDPETPSEPILFPKTPNSLIGDGEPICLPEIVDDYGFEEPRTDYEAELALIISRKCKNVSREEAPGCVLGYTALNDVSQRNIQNGDRSGWFRGKSFDTFAPIGPALVRPTDIPDVQNLSVRCRLNGKTVQDGNTAQMIFKIPEILSFVSRNFTLYPGDIITTGTPSGVGPIADGDVVEVEIEHIGILRNPVRAGCADG
jgi:2-keto-4-pentenoate hydratase/2-oxohepta-3-ene-1,7-dioic acid hydratase in catechol pathway